MNPVFFFFRQVTVDSAEFARYVSVRSLDGLYQARSLSRCIHARFPFDASDAGARRRFVP